MNRKFRLFSITTCILLFVEVLFVIIFSLFYIFDILNFQNLIQPIYFAYLILVLIVIDFIYFGFMMYSLYSVKNKIDIRTNDVVGSDIKEAYNFGNLGFIICDENNVITWESDLLIEKQGNIINKNIFEWCQALRDLINKDVNGKVNITMNSIKYDVKYLSSARLYIFRDVSDYENLRIRRENDALCLGVIMIDNYADVVGTNDDNNDVIAMVKNLIFEYARDFNILLRHFRSDAYFSVCTYENLLKMEKDGFSILDRVRHLGEGSSTQPTLSIGFAHEFPDVNKLNDMASNAIDIAMSRGGDQAVIAQYNSELKFYGGRTEATEKRNKVKVRVFGNSLVSLILQASNILIMGHSDMDMDAIGSALGIKAICDSNNKNSKIIYDPKLAEKKVRTAVASQFDSEDLEKIMISPKDCKDIVKPSTLIIVVDVSRPALTMFPKILENAEKIVCIDHHRRAEDFLENTVLSLIEPSASSASELIAEIIKYTTRGNIIKLPNKFATFMLSGIFLDTGFYKSKTVGLRTFDASAILKEYGADNSLADDLLKDEYEEYSLVNKILSTMKTPYYGIVCCNSGNEDIIERSTLAKVGNQCMQLKGINAVFVIGRTGNNEVRISARSDGSINVQLLCERMKGGGHFSMAAAAFKDKTTSEVEAKLNETLDQYLSQARNSVNKKEG